MTEEINPKMSTIVFVKQMFYLNPLFVLPQTKSKLPLWGGSLITYATVLPTRRNTQIQSSI